MIGQLTETPAEDIQVPQDLEGQQHGLKKHPFKSVCVCVRERKLGVGESCVISLIATRWRYEQSLPQFDLEGLEGPCNYRSSFRIEFKRNSEKKRTRCSMPEVL